MVCIVDESGYEIIADSIPVWQIAQKDYKFGKGKHISLTKLTYDAIANKFRDLWGKDAGWAQSVLFAADLSAFKERVSTKMETVYKLEDGERVVEYKSELLPVPYIKKEDDDSYVDTVVAADLKIEEKNFDIEIGTTPRDQDKSPSLKREAEETKDLMASEDMASRVKRRRRAR